MAVNSSDGKIYMVAQDSGIWHLGTVDPASGGFTSVAALASAYGIMSLSGVDSAAGLYYYWSPSSGGNALYTVNVSTGSVTVSPTILSGAPFWNRAQMAVDPGPALHLTYTPGAGGSVTGSSPQAVTYGGSGSAVSAVPATGYHFVSWSDSSTINPRTDANVTANVTVTANFAIDTHILTYTPGTGGSISGVSPQTVNHGGSGSVDSAVPVTGYHFVNWSDGSTVNPRTDMNVTGDVTVTANFAIDTHILTYTQALAAPSPAAVRRRSITTAAAARSAPFPPPAITL